MSLRQLQNATAKNIARSKSKKPPRDMNTDAKIVSVYDGDTCDLVISGGKKLERHKCRLAKIDAPEMNKKPNTLAKKARDFLAWLGTGKSYKPPSRFPRKSPPWSKAKLQSKLDANKSLVNAEFHNVGRYRRPIVTLKKTRKSRKTFNQYLIEKGYAKRYRKGRK